MSPLKGINSSNSIVRFWSSVERKYPYFSVGTVLFVGSEVLVHLPEVGVTTNIRDLWNVNFETSNFDEKRRRT